MKPKKLLDIHLRPGDTYALAQDFDSAKAVDKIQVYLVVNHRYGRGLITPQFIRIRTGEFVDFSPDTEMYRVSTDIRYMSTEPWRRKP